MRKQAMRELTALQVRSEEAAASDGVACSSEAVPESDEAENARAAEIDSLRTKVTLHTDQMHELQSKLMRTEATEAQAANKVRHTA